MLRNQLSDALSKYVTEQEQSSISSKLTDTEVGFLPWIWRGASALPCPSQLCQVNCFDRQHQQQAQQCDEGKGRAKVMYVVPVLALYPRPWTFSHKATSRGVTDTASICTELAA